jgi:hypothetical protein
MRHLRIILAVPPLTGGSAFTPEVYPQMKRNAASSVGIPEKAS